MLLLETAFVSRYDQTKLNIPKADPGTFLSEVSKRSLFPSKYTKLTSIIPLPPICIDRPGIPPHIEDSWELFIGMPPPIPPCEWP